MFTKVYLIKYLAEFFGTFLLILLGCGCSANILLKKTNGHNAGWFAMCTGWALAVAIPVYLFFRISGGCINPAYTLSLAIIGVLPWNVVIPYSIAELLGAFCGSVVVFAVFYDHFKITDDEKIKLSIFATGPALRNVGLNFLIEFVATACLTFSIVGIQHASIGPGWYPFLCGLVFLTLGLCLTGPAGCAINPARDLGPRIAHAILPVPGKGTSDWKYAWIPVVAPYLGGPCGALLYSCLFG